jgi:hypothetical protein
MQKFCLILLCLTIFTPLAFCQKPTQTVRGTILDNDSKLPLIGVAVVIAKTEPKMGTVTDENGVFRLPNVNVGKVSLQISYIGYEAQTIPDIDVTSGKEVVLNLNMQESVIQMQELVIRATENKGDALNEMSLTSARSISLEETKRFAGSFNDPSRILSSFAGVANSQNGDNDIIVRGNSPKYVQWRLEGVEITNPNHFAEQNAISGGISALNNNLLSTSDFYTGAFSAEYGDVLSGVYDVRLRAGNNEKFEASFGLGILGTDALLEGPFKKGYGGSYLVNYRYSTITLIDKLGLVSVGGVPKFQDAAFKVVLPTAKIGTFSLFGLGGSSSVLFEDVKPGTWNTPGDRGFRDDINEDFSKEAFLFNSGLNHTLPISKNSFLKTTLSYSTSGTNDDVFEIKLLKRPNQKDSILNRTVNFKGRLEKSTYRGAITYHNKINAKNKVEIGSKYALFGYDFNQSLFLESPDKRQTVLDFKENIGTLRNFASWRHRFNEDLTMVAGVHNMNVLFNKKSTIEPRLAFNWKLNNTNAINVGYGNHSNMESIHNYFAKITLKDGSTIEPNRDLDLLKAHHFVVGYEKRFTENLRAKVELYYQDLYNLPVENLDTSFYATINEGLEYKYVDLVNKGKGKNYGVEMTLERFLHNNFYFLINASLYDSKYTALEGIERNTQFNNNFLVNVLFGKEFMNLGKKKNQVLSLNAKIFYGGGKRYLPLLRNTEGKVAVDPVNNRYWDYKKAYNDKLPDLFQVTLSASYKFNKRKTTHEIYMNLDNVTNTIGKLSEYYDASKPNSVGYATQFGLFPNLMYRIYL